MHWHNHTYHQQNQYTKICVTLEHQGLPSILSANSFLLTIKNRANIQFMTLIVESLHKNQLRFFLKRCKKILPSSVRYTLPTIWESCEVRPAPPQVGNICQLMSLMTQNSVQMEFVTLYCFVEATGLQHPTCVCTSIFLQNARCTNYKML